MNVMLPIKSVTPADEIAHSVLGYDRATDALARELPVPMFLDTLAVKLADVPPEDKFGAASYPLSDRAVDAFRFLLGLEVDQSRYDYFLEPTFGQLQNWPKKKVNAAKLLAEVTPHPRYNRGIEPRISERELIFPTLRLLNDAPNGTLRTGELVSRLTDIFSPVGDDARILSGRRDTSFSQKVRNIIAHRASPSSFIHKGLANYLGNGLAITNLGKAAVRSLLSV